MAPHVLYSHSQEKRSIVMHSIFQ